ncbi:MAG: hypothetical protein ABIJ61_04440 [bacterium]
MSRSSLSKIVLSVTLLLFLVVGFACDDDSEEPSQPTGTSDLTVTNFSDCKSGIAKIAGASSTQECIEWQYADGVLSIHHVNAGFNCCVTALLASFAKEANEITITESEVLDQGGCNCLCLYDLDYQLNSFATGVYTFTIIGPYMETTSTPESDYLTFSVDLASEPSGSYCVDRDHYPWQ